MVWSGVMVLGFGWWRRCFKFFIYCGVLWDLDVFFFGFVGVGVSFFMRGCLFLLLWIGDFWFGVEEVDVVVCGVRSCVGGCFFLVMLFGLIVCKFDLKFVWLLVWEFGDKRWFFCFVMV